MKFCRQCGKTVAIFNDSDQELCPGCVDRKAAAADRTAGDQNNPAGLHGATLRVEDDKIILESSEGMLLWSGGGDRSHSLTTILDRASKILAIRSRKR